MPAAQRSQRGSLDPSSGLPPESTLSAHRALSARLSGAREPTQFGGKHPAGAARIAALRPTGARRLLLATALCQLRQLERRQPHRPLDSANHVGADRQGACRFPTAHCTRDRRLHPLAASTVGGLRSGRSPGARGRDLLATRRVGVRAARIRAHAGRDRPGTRCRTATHAGARKPDR